MVFSSKMSGKKQFWNVRNLLVVFATLLALEIGHNLTFLPSLSLHIIVEDFYSYSITWKWSLVEHLHIQNHQANYQTELKKLLDKFS